METILIGSDHAGFGMKEILKTHLLDLGYEVKDYGTNSETSVDYPDFAHPLAKAINEGEAEMGILVCGSGQGVCMTANKYLNVRAALAWTAEIAGLAREHNDANILCIPGRFISPEVAQNCVETFLHTEFAGGRHQQRVEKMRKC